MINPKSYIEIVSNSLIAWYVKAAEHTPDIIMGLVVFLIFLFTSKFFSKLAVNFFHKKFPKPDRENSVITLIKVFRFVIMILGTFLSLDIMGFSGFIWKFVGSLGVAGVIAGVALKDLVSSIFSGMLIGIDKAFKVGDYVTIGAHSGTVMDIGFLTTKIITDDGRKAYIPNQVIFNAPFYNITASPQRRLLLDFEIPNTEDISIAQSGILALLPTLDGIDDGQPFEVVFINQKQGNFILQVRFWVKIQANFVHTKSNALLQIKNQLAKDQIKLAEPSR